MESEPAFVQAMQEHPEDDSVRLAFADWLDRRHDSRGELLRLLHALTRFLDFADRRRLEDRLRTLLASGARPIGPFIANSIGMTFAWIPAGTFLMGSPESEQGRFSDVIGETPHVVTLPAGFYLATHLVTQAAWRKVMGDNPSHFQGDDLPVEQVSWDDCQEFLRKLVFCHASNDG
jgi:uncharacterized protein (TIGR02996 family)